MTYLLAIVAGLVGAALGWAIGFAMALLIGMLLGVSNLEGALAMTAMWGVGPIGGVVGLIVGIWMALRWRGHASLSAVAVRLPLVVSAIGALVAAGLWGLYEMRPGLGTSGSGPPRLDFEIRLPSGVSPPENVNRVTIQLNTEQNRMPGQVYPKRTRQEGDRAILAGSVELYYRSNWRLLDVTMEPGGPTRIFDLKLSARPGHMKTYGPWRRVDFLASGAGQPVPAPTREAHDLRIRVVYRDQELEEEAAARERR